MLPLVYDEPGARPGLGPWGALLGHVARNNAQWKTPAIGEAMVILAGPGRLHLARVVRHEARARPGRPDLELHHRPRLRPAGHPRRPGLGRGQRAAPGATTTRDAAGEPWSVDDAPEPYIAGQLRAIVGVEILIDRVEGKWKLSQNRSDADIAGAIEGLEATGERGRLARRCATCGRGRLGDRQPLKTRWTSLRPAARASMSSRVE